jgi:hypothetical protein
MKLRWWLVTVVLIVLMVAVAGYLQHKRRIQRERQAEVMRIAGEVDRLLGYAGASGEIFLAADEGVRQSIRDLRCMPLSREQMAATAMVEEAVSDLTVQCRSGLPVRDVPMLKWFEKCVQRSRLIASQGLAKLGAPGN